MSLLVRSPIVISHSKPEQTEAQTPLLLSSLLISHLVLRNSQIIFHKHPTVVLPSPNDQIWTDFEEKKIPTEGTFFG